MTPHEPESTDLRGLVVVASLLFLLSWAHPPGYDLGTAAAFAQIVDTDGQHVYDGAKPYMYSQLPELLKAVPELQGLEPAQSEEDLPGILDKAGERIRGLVESLPDTSSRENVTQEQLSHEGLLYSRKARSFNFLILTHRSGERVNLEEYRTDSLGRPVKLKDMESGFAVTTGLATSWAHFNPGNRSGAWFSLLGKQEIDGHKTYVVGFAQRPGWATVVGTYVWNQTSVLVLYQGIAWIDTMSYRIIRMRTDLLAPREDADLLRQTTEIQFGEAHFPEIASPQWLPQEVVVTIETSDRILRNHHHYSDYKLFRSESTVKALDRSQ
jgi:hypothetical protein